MWIYIFNRLPGWFLEDLLPLGCVSKHWCSIVDDLFRNRFSNWQHESFKLLSKLSKLLPITFVHIRETWSAMEMQKAIDMVTSCTTITALKSEDVIPTSPCPHLTSLEIVLGVESTRNGYNNLLSSQLFPNLRKLLYSPLGDLVDTTIDISGFEHLEVLRVDCNCVVHPDMTSLRTLDIIGNDVYLTEESWNDITSLVVSHGSYDFERFPPNVNILVMQMVNADISSLATLSNLTTLALNNWQESIERITELHSLQSLFIMCHDEISVASLSSMSNLKDLSLGNLNCVLDPESMSRLTNLTVLDCGDDGLALKEVSCLQNLNTLFGDFSYKTLSYLTNLTALKYFPALDQKISSIPHVIQLRYLHLSLSGDEEFSLYFQRLPLLEVLHIEGEYTPNRIYGLSTLSNLTALKLPRKIENSLVDDVFELHNLRYISGGYYFPSQAVPLYADDWDKKISKFLQGHNEWRTSREC